MIKRYNQFVEGKLNEDVYGGQPQTAPTPTETPTETPTRPRPAAPGVVPTEIPAEEDAPLAEYGEEEEVEGGDPFTANLKAVANGLGENAELAGNKVIYNVGKMSYEITFPSELYNSEKGQGVFEVTGEGGKKKFNTPDEVVDYLKANEPERMKTGEVDDAQAEEDLVKEFESKSYKFTRKLKSSKRK